MSSVYQSQNADFIQCDRAERLEVVDSVTGRRHDLFTQPTSGFTVVNCQEFDSYYYQLGNERIPATGNLSPENNHVFTVINFTTNHAEMMGDTRNLDIPNFTREIDVLNSSVEAEYFTNENNDVITAEKNASYATGSSKILLTFSDIKTIQRIFDGFIWISAGSNNYPNSATYLHVDRVDFDEIDENVYTASIGYTRINRVSNIRHRYNWRWSDVLNSYRSWDEIGERFENWNALLNAG